MFTLHSVSACYSYIHFAHFSPPVSSYRIILEFIRKIHGRSSHIFVSRHFGCTHWLGAPEREEHEFKSTNVLSPIMCFSCHLSKYVNVESQCARPFINRRVCSAVCTFAGAIICKTIHKVPNASQLEATTTKLLGTRFREDD